MQRKDANSCSFPKQAEDMLTGTSGSRFIRGWGVLLTAACLEAEEGELWQNLHDCDSYAGWRSSAAVSIVSSRQEGSGFESPGGQGLFCVDCAHSPCVPVGSRSQSSDILNTIGGNWRIGGPDREMDRVKHHICYVLLYRQLFMAFLSF